MTASVEQILAEEGPCLSSRVTTRLVSAGLSPAAARKRVERAGGTVRKLPLRFAHNERFLYLEGQRDGERYWANLEHALVTSRSAHGVALRSLIARGGEVANSDFHTISGSPISLRAHVSSERVRDDMLAIGLLEPAEGLSRGHGVRLAPPHFRRVRPAEINARALAEKILLDHLKQWVRKAGLASYDKVWIRGDEPLRDFSHFQWDLTAPSYLLPLRQRRRNGLVPGFVVADVAFSYFDRGQLAYFERKCAAISALRSACAFLPIMLAEGYDREALTFGHQEGYVLTTPGILFGEDIGEGLRDLVRSLSRAASTAEANPEVVGDLFRKLSRIEGAAANLRGPLFELIVGHCVGVLEGNSIDIGVKALTPDGKQADIDVLRVKGNIEAACYECRGKIGDLGVAEVERWLQQASVAYDWLRGQERFRRSTFVFELWTTGGFTVEALALLQNAVASTKRYRLAWKDGPQVREYVERVGNRSLRETLEEHYLAPALTAAMQRAASKAAQPAAPESASMVEAENPPL